ncbi:MAG: GNAT family N-acetyltransferase [Candidatus Zixiibacteriota bacterium]
MHWECRHPKQIPREQWLDWLTATSDPSPYLLPEWGLFWEAIWPDARAEAWVLSDDTGRAHAVIPVTRRRRLGWEMCHAQPFGTPCGPLTPNGHAHGEELGGFMLAAIGPRTVEFACHPDLGAPPGRWTKQTLRNDVWQLQLEGDISRPRRGYSESHRRNIRRGEELQPRLSDLESAADVTRLLSTWKDRGRPSRIVLVPQPAGAMMELFAPTGALRFRVAWVGDRPAAVAVFLVHRDHAVYVDGAFDREPRFQGVGHWLFAETLSALRREGVRVVNLGGGAAGDSGAGLAQFKHGWGAEPAAVHTAVYRRPWYHALHTLFRPRG